jgi:uncharacterized protein (TIGR02145 family)
MNNFNGTDLFGFKGYPSGIRAGDPTSFFAHKESNVTFWTSTAYNSSNSWFRRLYYNESRIMRKYYYNDRGYSVRCIKD